MFLQKYFRTFFRGGSLLRRVEHHTDDVAVVEVQLRVIGVGLEVNIREEDLSEFLNLGMTKAKTNKLYGQY